MAAADGGGICTRIEGKTQGADGADVPVVRGNRGDMQKISRPVNDKKK